MEDNHMSGLTLCLLSEYPPVESTEIIGQNLSCDQIQKLNEEWILWTHWEYMGTTFYFVKRHDLLKAKEVLGLQ